MYLMAVEPLHAGAHVCTERNCSARRSSRRDPDRNDRSSVVPRKIGGIGCLPTLWRGGPQSGRKA